MALESPTCSYLLQPVKPLETTEQSCQKRPSHISPFQGKKMLLLPGGLYPSFVGMHHFAHLSPAPILRAWMSYGKLTIQSSSLERSTLQKVRRRPRHTLYVQSDNETMVSVHVKIQVTPFFSGRAKAVPINWGEPERAGLHCARTCVCLLACLQPYTVNFK